MFEYYLEGSTVFCIENKNLYESKIGFIKENGEENCVWKFFKINPIRYRYSGVTLRIQNGKLKKIDKSEVESILKGKVILK